MNKETMIRMAERNLNKVNKSLLLNRERKGITEQELENLSNNVEYARVVYDLIINMKEEL